MIRLIDLLNTMANYEVVEVYPKETAPCGVIGTVAELKEGMNILVLNSYVYNIIPTVTRCSRIYVRRDKDTGGDECETWALGRIYK